MTPLELTVDGPQGPRAVRITHPDRICFPERGITKADVVRYFLAVGDGILRALHERPTMLQRWPSGVTPGATLSVGKRAPDQAFFQRRVPRGAPAWVRTVHIPGAPDPGGGAGSAPLDAVCPTEPAVVAWAANLGTLTFHPWTVRRTAQRDRGPRVHVDANPQTVASAYSVRPNPRATVSAPVTWDELADVTSEDLDVTTMPDRFAAVGDLHAALDAHTSTIEPLLAMADRDGRADRDRAG
ncbi:MAG TPA: hypothetical protein VK875_13635 [Euzebyales bacterium]|nr:hypothetical protein [Euzebyales bacterium]